MIQSVELIMRSLKILYIIGKEVRLSVCLLVWLHPFLTSALDGGAWSASPVFLAPFEYEAQWDPEPV
jgi:hypothetical protein